MSGKITPLVWAISQGHLNTVKYLISKGCKYNFIKNRTHLIEATSGGYLDIVKYIVSNYLERDKPLVRIACCNQHVVNYLNQHNYYSLYNTDYLKSFTSKEAFIKNRHKFQELNDKGQCYIG